MAKKKIVKGFTVDATGFHETETEVPDVEPLPEDVSEARRRLMALRSQRGSRIETVIIQDETWFLKRLSWPQLVALSLDLSRDNRGALLVSADATRELTVAILTHCVAKAADDDEPYFSKREACEFVDEPAAIRLVSGIFSHSLELNPDIIPDARKRGRENPTKPSGPA